MEFKDFNDIVRLRYEYALGIDTRDWTLYRSIFSDVIHMDFSSYSGQPAADMPADTWVDSCKVLFTGLDATQHVMTNPVVDIDPSGQVARLRMYMKAEHFLQHDGGSPDYALGGYYDDQVVKTEEGWRITGVTLNVFWNRGNRNIMTLAAQRGAERLAEAAKR